MYNKLNTMKSATCVCKVIFLLVVGLVCEGQVVVSSGFVETRGTGFIVDGSPFLFNGFNSYWMMTVASQPSQRSKISDVFREAAAAGLTVCRTWAFSDGGDQALQMSPGVYNEAVFQVIFNPILYTYVVLLLVALSICCGMSNVDV